MRIYATRLLNRLGAKVAVEVSLTRLKEGEQSLFGLVIRDANRLEPVRTGQPDAHQLPNSGQKVVELVGSTTLKDIVAETTDVVEKMCIETAVTLTRNNRVAAAEMLGLSRQSLYVKLRKYGLLSRD
jgi:transcriptional regulator PpsR